MFEHYLLLSLLNSVKTTETQTQLLYPSSLSETTTTTTNPCLCRRHIISLFFSLCVCLSISWRTTTTTLRPTLEFRCKTWLFVLRAASCSSSCFSLIFQRSHPIPLKQQLFHPWPNRTTDSHSQDTISVSLSLSLSNRITHKHPAAFVCPLHFHTKLAFITWNTATEPAGKTRDLEGEWKKEMNTTTTAAVFHVTQQHRRLIQ